jgi:hypothetical protein
MKQSTNKAIITILVLSIFIFSCKTDKKSSDANEKAKDTITTVSGLKYFYITKGEGRKVAPGSKVTAMLSLKVNDSVIWTSYKSKDSSFTYIADRGGVIKGYNEMVMLLREGDDVAAFLPGSIAYGEKGSGKVIPPNATLEYDQFKIVHVGEPRLLLTDTLFHTLKNDGIKKMKVMYNHITMTNDSTLYHGGMDQLSGLWRKLSSASLYKEAYDAFSFIGKNSDDTTLKYYVISSLEEQGKLKEAISKIDEALKGKLSADQKEYFIKYKQDLTTELEKK